MFRTCSASLDLLLCLSLAVYCAFGEGIYDFTVKDIDGKEVSFGKYKGQLLLIVNVASQCGYTDENYKSLQAIYEKYKDSGFSIAAFPCNQFGKQEPWPTKEIKEWVGAQYAVSFDMFSKVKVKGKKQHPLFTFLQSSDANAQAPISWNFDGKFLINGNGEVIRRFTNGDALSHVDGVIGAEIAKKEL
mmetsp:Transcript_20778/g.33256  ORF Transcript_20778/g.33256 Transcript_20778/m.33256 type:complete len:188 (-) Transcript_20778:106-669(-)